jgi:hypothetical protein
MIEKISTSESGNQLFCFDMGNSAEPIEPTA